jgi:uncharacterized domain HDIG
MKINKKILKQIETEAKKYFVNASGCHDWTHIERVYKLAMNIGRQEGADLKILAAACLLHDIGRRAEFVSRGKARHEVIGPKQADKILRRLKLDQNIIDNIVHCVAAHRYYNKLKPETLEAKVLFDADKLDSLGAVGVGRIFLFAGYFKNPIYTGREKKLAKSGAGHSYSKEDTAVLEYEVKLKYVKDRILTAAGKKIAQGRHDFMVLFFKNFWEEVEGAK